MPKMVAIVGCSGNIAMDGKTLNALFHNRKKPIKISDPKRATAAANKQ